MFQKILTLLRRKPRQLSLQQRRKLKSFFLNHPRDIAIKHHPEIAWAYHVHGLMLSFYEDVLETPTFCESTQIRHWQKANQVALAILDDKPIPFPLDAKMVRQHEMIALRKDIDVFDKSQGINYAFLPAHRYLTWSQIYFEHFPSQGIDQTPLEQLDMLAEQAVILAHPYLLPHQSQQYKRYVANCCLKQLAWDIPFYHPEELPLLVKTMISDKLSCEKISAEILKDEQFARECLKNTSLILDAPPCPERALAIEKIKELQALLAFPRQDNWSKLNMKLRKVGNPCNSISRPSHSVVPSSGASPYSS